MTVNLCQLEHLSCFGCCGRDWGGKKEVLVQIGKNTELFRHMEKGDFSKRGEVLSSCGACKSLIADGERVVCGLHPARHKGKDYRDQYCDKSYLCPTFKAFLKWDRKKQGRFVAFILGRGLDNWQYSMGMDSGKLKREFEREKG